MAINYKFNIGAEKNSSLFDLVKAGDPKQLQQAAIQLADLDERDIHQKTLTLYAADNQAILDYLFTVAENFFIENDQLNPQKIDPRGRSILHWAAKCNQNLDTMQALVQQGADVNAHANPFKATPLYLAAQEGHSTALKALIALNADVNFAAFNGALAIHAAAHTGKLEMVAALINAGCQIDQGCSQNGTALYSAAEKGHADIVALLLAKGANPNTTTSDGSTPIYVASQNGHANVVQQLIDAGADVNAACHNGTTPIQSAQHFKHDAVVNLLKTAGAIFKAATEEANV